MYVQWTVRVDCKCVGRSSWGKQLPFQMSLGQGLLRLSRGSHGDALGVWLREAEDGRSCSRVFALRHHVSAPECRQ